MNTNWASVLFLANQFILVPLYEMKWSFLMKIFYFGKNLVGRQWDEISV
jgi:hypothetical protein